MIDASFFAANRQRLLAQLPDDAIVCMTAYTGMQLSGDAVAPFQQEASFWYLTGMNEPDWQVIMTPNKTWLVEPYVSDIHRVFDGGISGGEAIAQSGADEVISKESAKKLLVQLAKQHNAVYALGRDPYEKYYSFSLNPAPGRLWTRLTRLFAEVHDVRPYATRLRAIKQPEEVAAIREAISVTVDAFRGAKHKLGMLTSEYELEAIFTGAFRMCNAKHAYEPIVAVGANACTLHYAMNEAPLRQDELVLLDIGARVGCYAADITRTYSVGGHATERQRQVHGAVKLAHEAIVALIKPGLSFATYQDQSDEIMKNALLSLDLLENEADYRRYFPHAISHGLGIDVHDSLGGYKELQPGMVLTVEPGIYIPEEKLGVRLEDDILVTDTGAENLSETLALDL